MGVMKKEKKMKGGLRAHTLCYFNCMTFVLSHNIEEKEQVYVLAILLV